MTLVRAPSVLDAGDAARPGCGRGQKAHELARRGWEAVGIDNVPRAIDAARRAAASHATFVVGDVTDLGSHDLGGFDFFLDVDCLQHLSSEQRPAMGRGVAALANPGATLLMLEFGATRLRSVVGGVSTAEVEAAFPRWEMLSAEPADTTGMGWALTRTAPQWYRLRRGATSTEG